MKKILVRSVPRENDLRVLDWLMRRYDGESCTQIGARWGVSDQTVYKATELIRTEDLAHACQTENEQDVRKGYW